MKKWFNAILIFGFVLAIPGLSFSADEDSYGDYKGSKMHAYDSYKDSSAAPKEKVMKTTTAAKKYSAKTTETTAVAKKEMKAVEEELNVAEEALAVAEAEIADVDEEMAEVKEVVKETKEKWGAASGSSSADKAIQDAMKAYILADINSLGYFGVADENTPSRKLTFEKIHSKVQQFGDSYIACADFKDNESGEAVDVDFTAQKAGNTWNITFYKVHRIGKDVFFKYNKDGSRVSLN